MMGRSPKCYIPSFVEIGLPVQEKKFTIYGRGGHLGHVTSIMLSNFHFLVPESFGPFDLGPMSRNDLDLQCSLTFINSVRCLLLPTSRSLAAIVSEKSTIFTYPMDT